MVIQHWLLRSMRIIWKSAACCIEKSHINDRYEADATAAILAARNGNDVLIRQLSKLGADLNLRDKAGLNALDYAEKRNHASTKILLASLGVKSTRPQAADVSAVPVERTEFYKGWTDLMIAAWKGNEQQCSDYLKKDDVNAKDPQGHTALMRAAMNTRSTSSTTRWTEMHLAQIFGPTRCGLSDFRACAGCGRISSRG